MLAGGLACAVLLPATRGHMVLVDTAQPAGDAGGD
jgi:hypothetical protein